MQRVRRGRDPVPADDDSRLVSADDEPPRRRAGFRLETDEVHPGRKLRSRTLSFAASFQPSSGFRVADRIARPKRAARLGFAAAW